MQIMALFYLEILVKVLHARYNHGYISVTTYAIDLKLHSCVQGCQTVKLDNFYEFSTNYGPCLTLKNWLKFCMHGTIMHISQ